MDRWDVFSCLADATDRWLKVWNQGAGFNNVRHAWLDLAYGIGKPIWARLGDRTEQGIFCGIDESGALMLEKEDGSQKKISSGDVFFSAGHTEDEHG